MKLVVSVVESVSSVVTRVSNAGHIDVVAIAARATSSVVLDTSVASCEVADDFVDVCWLNCFAIVAGLDDKPNVIVVATGEVV